MMSFGKHRLFWERYTYTDPNHARDFIEIDAGKGRDLSLPENTIHVYNALGESVIVGADSEPALTKIDISGLPPGVGLY